MNAEPTQRGRRPSMRVEAKDTGFIIRRRIVQESEVVRLDSLGFEPEPIDDGTRYHVTFDIDVLHFDKPSITGAFKMVADSFIDAYEGDYPQAS